MMAIKYNLRYSTTLLILITLLFSPFIFAEETEKESTPQTAATKDAASSNVLFILDASGSMWGEIDGKPKISIAKDVMTKLVNELPANIKTGLEVYGHRKKGDCNDIEILTHIGEKNNKALIQQLNTIQPKGKTPLTGSLEKAADVLKTYEEASSVVLISDGKETCNADPCATVKNLREQGINVRVHVVGFDVKNDEKAQLNCIAEAGGGKYFDANNAEELNAALSDVKKEVEQAEPIIEEKPEPKSDNGIIKIATIFAENTDPIKSDLSYTVYKAEKDINGKQEKVAHSYDAQPSFKLNEGKYLITVKYGGNASGAKSSLDIDTKTLESNEQIINLNAGFLKLSAIPKAEAEPLTSHLTYNVFYTEKTLEGKKKKVAFSHNAAPRFVLPENQYGLDIKYGGNESNVRKTIDELTVEAGKTTEQIIDLNFGILKLSSVLKEGQEALSNKLSYKIYSAEKNLEGKRASQTFSYDASPKFKLTAGKYYIEVKHGGNASNVLQFIESIEVPAGIMTEQTMVLDAGYVEVSTSSNGSPITNKLNYQVKEKQANIEGKHKKAAFSYGAKPLFRLKAGDYIISVKQGDKIKEVEVNVKAGEKTSVDIVL